MNLRNFYAITKSVKFSAIFNFTDQQPLYIFYTTSRVLAQNPMSEQSKHYNIKLFKIMGQFLTCFGMS